MFTFCFSRDYKPGHVYFEKNLYKIDVKRLEKRTIRTQSDYRVIIIYQI